MDQMLQLIQHASKTSNLMVQAALWSISISKVQHVTYEISSPAKGFEQIFSWNFLSYEPLKMHKEKRFKSDSKFTLKGLSADGTVVPSQSHNWIIFQPFR